MVVKQFIISSRMATALNYLLRRGQSLMSKNNVIILHNIRQEHTKLQGRGDHKVNNLEKRFLVWTGKYKTLEEVPTFVE